MVASKEIKPFETTRIMTGTMVPKGSDAIIMLEAVKEIEKNGEKYIAIKRKVKKRRSVDNYQIEGVHETTFLNENVAKYHRTIPTYINVLIYTT